LKYPICRNMTSLRPLPLVAAMEQSLPPRTATELAPYRDLTGQIRMTEEYNFAIGGFSDVYMGEWSNPLTGEVVPVAIKILRGVHTDPRILEITTRRLNRETRIWHSLSHENILPFLGLCRKIGPSPAMISPLCNRANVHEYLASRPRECMSVILGVARGLEYLHFKGVIHGDIKLHNVLMDNEGNPRLSDFGRSKIIDTRGYTTQFSGSIRYLAPELAAHEDPCKGMTRESDVFAFAMLTLEMLTGKVPFSYMPEMLVVAHVQNGGRPERSKCWPTVFTEPMWQLLENCWDEVPTNRLDMNSIVHRLEQMQ